VSEREPASKQAREKERERAHERESERVFRNMVLVHTNTIVVWAASKTSVNLELVQIISPAPVWLLGLFLDRSDRIDR